MASESHTQIPENVPELSEPSHKEYILVTGGAGYIGSHTVIELVNSGHNVVIVDNLINSSFDAVARIEYIVQQKVPFHKVDVCDGEALAWVFRHYNITGVVHFAALKAVGESTQVPLNYYYNNVRGTLCLLAAMEAAQVKTIVFSSSATVYGDATRFENMIPIPEHCPKSAESPYGQTKAMIEQILLDVQKADPTWRTAILRYFNPIGAHASGLLGEDPRGIPNNLLPYLAQVAVGRQEQLRVFGNDYETRDGTPIRDYIHVVDLAKGHICALAYMQRLAQGSGLYREWNLGTGKGTTVMEIYAAFCDTIGRKLPYEVTGRRLGDVVNLTADPGRANAELNWLAEFSVGTACKDLWKWTTQNPYGFSCDQYEWELFGDSEGSTESLEEEESVVSKRSAQNIEYRASYQNRLHTVTFPEADFSVSIANYGATITSIVKNGHQYTHGFDTLVQYTAPENPYFGATIGRYANRISNATISLDGTESALDANENLHTLHGGRHGFHQQLFLGPVVRQLSDGAHVTLDFVHVDANGSNGFPGDLVTFVKYTVGRGTLEVEYEAKLAENSHASATAVNLTNHAYFNPGSSATVDGLVVRGFTSRCLELDQHKLPTGKVVESIIDLSAGHKLGASDVFDHCFVTGDKAPALDTRNQQPTQIFEVSCPKSGRRIDFFSTEPAFQLYTGDGVKLDDRPPRCGLCVEPGRYTNAVNMPDWAAQVVVRKGDVYGSCMRYVFG